MEIRALRLLLAMAPVAAFGQTEIDLRTQSKNVDFSQALSTRTTKIGATLPAACSLGETFFLTTAANGNNLYGCTAANVWTLLSGNSGSTLPPVSGEANKVLSNDGVFLRWAPLGGDVTGAPEALAVTRIQGRGIASTLPTNAQCLVWNTASAQWRPGDCASAGAFAINFSSQLTWTLPGSTHQLGTCDVQVSTMKTATTTWEEIEWERQTCETAAGATQYDIVVTWATPQSGRMLVLKGGGGPSGGGGSGEANTASNIGAGGIGIFKQKTGVTLELKNLNAASNRISVTNDAANNEVDVDVVQSNLSLASIGGSLGATQIAVADKTGNGPKIATSSGALVSGNCVRIDATGNFVDHGAACGGGGGGGGAPGGSDKNIQYNNNAVLGGVSNNATATRMFLYQENAGTPGLAPVRAADIPAVFAGYLEAQFSHDFGPISNAVPSCAAQAFLMPGAVPGTSGTAAAHIALPVGVNVQAVKVTALNTVSVEICNRSATASYNPEALTFTVVLVGSQYR